MESTQDAQTAAAMVSFFGIFITIYLVIIVGFVAAHIIPIWRILKRMGFAPGWAFLFIAPFGTLVGLYLIAFSEWPIEKRLAAPPAPPPPVG